MKAAVVESFSQPPRYLTFSDVAPEKDEVLVNMRCAALSQLVRSKAAGTHYTSRADFPFIPGVDGVGTLGDGRHVYFAFPRFPFGTMAERVPVARGLWVDLPADITDITAAAIANPAMSSWAALTKRAKFTRGENVLINGATGSSGRLAVQIAKHLGAKKVIATGRNPEVLAELRDLGADAVISLDQDQGTLLQRLKEEIWKDGIDVVLDYLWGVSAEQIIGAIASGPHVDHRLRFVQIGSVSGPNITLPASVLRSMGFELMGSGLGSVALPDLMQAVAELLRAAGPAKLQIETETAALLDVEKAWNRDTGNRRLVFCAS